MSNPDDAPQERSRQGDENNHQGFRPADKIAAGSLVVAALSVIGSLVVAFHHDTSQAELDRVDFLRTQRQSAYVTFIADSQRVQQLEHQVLIDRRSARANGFTLAEMSELHDRYVDSMRVVLIDVGRVQLMTSGEVSTAALDTVTQMQLCGDVVFASSDSVEGEIAVISHPDDLTAQQYRGEVMSAISRFIQEARREVTGG